ncbi:protein asteroid-like [Melitaea cinxia]|uniref:protein asteroid-like n=1 Tax=Melitaea cinxia TaxID=113334 RepID=UPI001E271E67|nr:protein asteroid-like [Melitaea cinxia]
MGVRGLTSYVNSNQDVLMKSFYLHNTNLIIDGYSLCAKINISMCGFPAFGGNYDKFASSTRTFFKNLRKCNVTPHVIFDGCHETKKLHTVFRRLLDKLNEVAHMHPAMQSFKRFFPFLLRDVFRKVLSDMEINYTICKFEADKVIASLARHMNCPVLSYDSDFFIYNVIYIPLCTLQFKPKLLDENGTEVFAMQCKIYKVQYLCDHFRGFDEKNLPLLATLLGNDYVDKRIFVNVFSHLKLCEREARKSQEKILIHTLFNWLQNETLGSAIAKILRRFRKDQRHEAFAIIKSNYEQYNCDVQVLKYFDIIELDSLSETSPIKPNMEMEVVSDSTNFSVNFGYDEEWLWQGDEAITYHKFESIPAWFAEKIYCEKIPPVYLNLYAHHLQICNPQAEDFTERDSFLCSLSIVRLAFDILTDFSYDYCYYVSRAKEGYKRIKISKQYSIPRPFDVSFKEMNDEQLKLCFKYFLHFKLSNLDLPLIEMLPSNFQLFMISMLWWIASCSVPEAHVHSLIMSYITLEVIDEKTGTARGHNRFNKRHAEKLEEIRKNKISYEAAENELFLNNNKVQHDDCLIAASAILKLFEIDDSIQKNPKSYDIKRIHSFAQFQCVLHQMNSLNTLCSKPFESTIFSKCYNGILIYNIALKLQKYPDPLSFFDEYIKDATTVLLFYKSIYSIYKKLVTIMRLSTVQWSNMKRKTRWD